MPRGHLWRPRTSSFPGRTRQGASQTLAQPGKRSNIENSDVHLDLHYELEVTTSWKSKYINYLMIHDQFLSARRDVMVLYWDYLCRAFYVFCFFTSLFIEFIKFTTYNQPMGRLASLQPDSPVPATGPSWSPCAWTRYLRRCDAPEWSPPCPESGTSISRRPRWQRIRLIVGEESHLTNFNTSWNTTIPRNISNISPSHAKTTPPGLE